MTFNLVTACDLGPILQRPFFISLHKNIRFSDIMQFSDSFCGHQMCHQIKIYGGYFQMLNSRFSDTFGPCKNVTKSHNVTKSNDFI